MKVSQAVKQATGMNFTTYCETVLETDYKSFHYRLKRGIVRLNEINQILQDTGLSYEQLFRDKTGDNPPDLDPRQKDKKTMGGQKSQPDQGSTQFPGPEPDQDDSDSLGYDIGDLY